MVMVVIWVFKQLGLLIFLADVGVKGGPSVVEALTSFGPLLILLSILIGTLPLVIGYLVGDRSQRKKWYNAYRINIIRFSIKYASSTFNLRNLGRKRFEKTISITKYLIHWRKSWILFQRVSTFSTRFQKGFN